MPTYPTYKLGEIAKIYNGNSINAEEKEKKYKGVDGRNYIGTKDIDFECSVNYNNGVKIPYDEGKFKIAPAESVLVCAEGGSAGKKSAFITEDVCFGNKLFAITNNQGLFDGKYVFYYTRYKRFFDLFKNELSGLIGGVSSKKFGEIPIPLPPLATQRAIVTRIETLFAELDKAVQHLRTAQQQLKTYRQAVLNHWLNNEDGKWETVPIKEIISVISNGSTPKADKMFSKGEIQFLKVYNLNFDGSINLSKEPVFIERDTHETLLKRSQTKQGDVLINIVGPPLGKVSIVPEGEKEYNINQAIVMFRPNEFVISKFLAYYLMSPQIIEWLTSTSKATAGQYNVKVSTCREIMFPKVSIQEQQRIVKEIESRLSQATASETYIENALQQAEALRQSILKKAFSGELV